MRSITTVVLILVLPALVCALCLNSVSAQDQEIRQSIRQRLAQGSSGNSFRQTLRKRFQQRFNNANRDIAGNTEKLKIAGLDVAVWRPPSNIKKPVPLIVFSHGFHGINTQSIFLMQALSGAGFLVMAPNHKDAMGGGSGFSDPQVPFRNPEAWSDKTHQDRAEDITRLIEALHKDPQWNSQIDWSGLVLAGHSLGGYTVLGLSGAWPSWKIPGVKAVLALSPLCQPLIRNGHLSQIGIPVMYQGGTRDFGITPFIKRSDGAFSKTSSPAYFVEFDKATHFAWSNLNQDKKQRDLIDQYCIAFLHKYVQGIPDEKLDAKLPGVATLEVK